MNDCLIRVSSFPLNEQCGICRNPLVESQIEDDHVVAHPKVGFSILETISILFSQKFVHHAHESCSENWRTSDINRNLPDFACAGGCMTRFRNQPPSRVLPTFMQRLNHFEIIPLMAQAIGSRAVTLLSASSALYLLGTKKDAIFGMMGRMITGAMAGIVIAEVPGTIRLVRAAANREVVIIFPPPTRSFALRGAIIGAGIEPVLAVMRLIPPELAVNVAAAAVGVRSGDRIFTSIAIAVPVVTEIFMRVVGDTIALGVIVPLFLIGAYAYMGSSNR